MRSVSARRPTIRVTPPRSPESSIGRDHRLSPASGSAGTLTPREHHPRQADAGRPRGQVAGALGRAGHLHLRPHRRPATRCIRSTRRRRRCRARSTPGHVCSFTHTDTIARYQRMQGKEVFYPMGWDDNGLNVERRVQMLTATSSATPRSPTTPTSRPRSPTPRASCPRTRSASPAPTSSSCAKRSSRRWSRSTTSCGATVGLSVDWDADLHHHRPGRDPHLARRASSACSTQGVAYRSGAPTLWDVDMKTAVAQAELEDRELPGAYHKLAFGLPGGGGPDGDVDLDRHHPPRAAAGVRRPRRPPRRRALPAAVRPDRRSRPCSASRSRSAPTSWPSPTRAPASP